MLNLSLRRVVGDSMLPYLKENRLILVRSTKQLRVGNVVGFRFDGQTYIKRIYKIDGDLIYVLGDNINNSLDSRKFGWISRNNIEFKLLLRL
jgi:phage repressor protein C with HTH and peptisase S24 domain